MVFAVADEVDVRAFPYIEAKIAAVLEELANRTVEIEAADLDHRPTGEVGRQELLHAGDEESLLRM